MRVLPYFQSIIPRPKVAPVHVESGSRSADRRYAPAPSGETQPQQDKFVPTSLATGIVYSIKNDSKTAMMPIPGGAGNPEQSSGIVKSGMYSLYRLDGSLEKKPASPRGRSLDLRG